MTSIILFDNSALSRLVEESDGDRNALVAGLRILGTLRVSALNILETIRTPDEELRYRKLQFFRVVGGPIAPINEPMELMERICRAHHERAEVFEVGDSHLFHFLDDPESATDEARAALTAWASEQEKAFKDRHRLMRERFATTFKSAPDQRFATEHDFIQFVFDEAPRTLHGLVNGIYLDATGVGLAADEVPQFLEAAKPIKVFIAAQLHALWLRSVAGSGPGKKAAGSVDTDSAVYLGWCDRFITNDHAQAVTLRTANRWNARGTRVDVYTDLRRLLTLS